jgi:hypothetical protein
MRGKGDVKEEKFKKSLKIKKREENTKSHSRRAAETEVAVQEGKG